MGRVTRGTWDAGHAESVTWDAGHAESVTLDAWDVGHTRFYTDFGESLYTVTDLYKS